MDRALIEEAVRAVLKRTSSALPLSKPILVETSARHVHLSKADCQQLFGRDALAKARDISQPGQFLSDARVRIIGPKGVLDNVAVLGPTRSATQVEISWTDARALGVNAPVRLSGDLTGAANVHLQAGDKVIEARAAIVAERHLHLTLAEAAEMGLKDRQTVSVRVGGARPLTLEGVVVRAVDPSAARLHIDADEANAAGVSKDTTCTIEACAAAPSAPAPRGSSEAAAQISGKLISEEAARALIRQGAKQVQLSKGQLITPLARDCLRSGGVTVIEKEAGA